MKIDVSKLEDEQLRDLLVNVAVEWERRFAVAPRITADIAEYDAAQLVSGLAFRVHGQDYVSSGRCPFFANIKVLGRINRFQKVMI